jgi:hypothetical protein
MGGKSHTEITEGCRERFMKTEIEEVATEKVANNREEWACVLKMTRE